MTLVESVTFLSGLSVPVSEKIALVRGEAFALVKRHTKVRRAGYLGNTHNIEWVAERRRTTQETR